MKNGYALRQKTCNIYFVKESYNTFTTYGLQVMKTNPQLLLEKIQVIWPLILEIKDNVQFHAVTCAFVALAFHPKLLICCHDIQDSVMVVLQQVRGCLGNTVAFKPHKALHVACLNLEEGPICHLLYSV